jgi:formyl-CoA transferase
MAALDGMRVMDMTQYEAGTSCTQFLAWLGADVVKIESPAGDPGRQAFRRGTHDSQYFLNYNSNKRSIVLDLSCAEGRDLFLRMTPNFNVFVENFGPGVIEKLNIGYDVMKAVNPSIIYARIKGFGSAGPYADYKVFDPLAQAAAGIFSVTGQDGGPPTQPGATLSDSGTGSQMALAITAAYVQQQREGVGQLIDMSMQEATLTFMKTRPVTEWASGRPIQRRGSRGGAPTGMYPCAPGGPNDYVYIHVATTRMWDALCVGIDKPHLADDPRFATGRDRAANAEELRTEIEEWTMARTKFEAMHDLASKDVPISAIFDTADVFADPHLKARGFFETVAHAEAGEVTLMRSPLRLPESEVALRAPPLLGEHTGEVLQQELGLSADEVGRLRDKRVVG